MIETEINYSLLTSFALLSGGRGYGTTDVSASSFSAMYAAKPHCLGWIGRWKPAPYRYIMILLGLLPFFAGDGLSVTMFQSLYAHRSALQLPRFGGGKSRVCGPRGAMTSFRLRTGRRSFNIHQKNQELHERPWMYSRVTDDCAAIRPRRRSGSKGDVGMGNAGDMKIKALSRYLRAHGYPQRCKVSTIDPPSPPEMVVECNSAGAKQGNRPRSK